jgi:hypothetical protein
MGKLGQPLPNAARHRGGKTTTSVQVDSELWEAIKVQAAEEGLTAKEMLRRAAEIALEVSQSMGSDRVAPSWHIQYHVRMFEGPDERRADSVSGRGDQ